MGRSGSTLISGILRRYGVLALLLFVVFAFGAGVASVVEPPDYYSRTSAEIAQDPSKIVSGLSSLTGGDPMLDEMAVLESATIKQFVADKLHLTAKPVPNWLPSPIGYQIQRGLAFLHLAPAPVDYGRLDYPIVDKLSLDFAKAEKNKYVVNVDGQGSYSLLVNRHVVDTQPVGSELKSRALNIALSGFSPGVKQSWRLVVTDPTQIVSELSLHVRVFRVGDKSRTIGVGCTEGHPQLSARIVKEMMDWYQNRDITIRQQASREALKFIDQQIDELKGDILKLRDDMKKLLSDRGRLIASQQSDSVADGFLQQGVQLNELQTERAQVAALQGQLKSSNDSLGYYRSLEVPGVIETDLVGKLIETRQQIDDALQTKTEEHPDVVELRQQLEAEKTSLQKLLGETVKQLDRKIGSAGENMGKFQKLLDLTPDASLELSRLRGEIDVRNQGLTALYPQKLEATLQKINDVSSVNVLDPATPNPRPVRPRLGQVAFSAIIFSLLATLASIMLLRANDPRVTNADDLDAAFGLPVLATLRSDGQAATELEQRRLAARTARLLQQLETPAGVLLAYGKPTSAALTDKLKDAVSKAGGAAEALAGQLQPLEASGLTAVYNAQLAGLRPLIVATTGGPRRIRELNALRSEAEAAGLEVVAFVLLER